MESFAINKTIKTAVDSLGRSYGTGLRKESVARVWIKPGTGKFNINRKEKLLDYFKRESVCQVVRAPFVATSTLDKYDIFATVKGGGLSGQAGALAHGISRALSNVSQDLHSILRNGGFLTRDPRVVERKKYGQHKARKKCQFSKR
ncbi:30S ribosomal protein S9 [Wolbachia endosymbiont of Ctenocephalides felis wCfeT]|uniref:30S ribosomal protein S9 n=1 Tax=Wolbachia endosymbiont of Ctenocephalides felis wCfeT TaxID=2732593 RepID=UPI001445B9E2|nr:30S ribosomal protein S9 [Wolbachia endosymbiont of Ctenocephalides felis wCfeT]